MFDPELYLSEYEAKDTKTGQNRVLTCRYRDATVGAEDDINFESTATKNDERLSYFCVAIPGNKYFYFEVLQNLNVPLLQKKLPKVSVNV